MGKLLLWAIVVLAALVVTRLLAHHAAAKDAVRRRAARRSAAGSGAESGAESDTAPEAMVRCAYCGVHLPRSEALLQSGQLWCCAEHARLGLNPSPSQGA